MIMRLLYTWLACWAVSVSSKSIPIPDPCAAISGKTWVLPREARACMSSFPLDSIIKANTIEVVNKTLAFHTSNDVHEDLAADLVRLSKQDYSSEFDFHLDIYRSFKRVNDGHCGVFNYCYDSLYITYIPLPLVLLTAADGSQNVHIAPEAFKVASNEFKDEVEFWQQSLPGRLKGKLATLSGAKVFLINGKEPFVAVNKNADITGGYQSFATRQNSFFASYTRGANGWQYSMGNFALQAHPLVDFVELTVQRVNSSTNDTFTFGAASKNFTDSASYRLKNCVANNGPMAIGVQAYKQSPPPIAYFQQQPPVNPEESRKQPMNVMLDALPLTDIDLPEHLQPSMPALNQSYSVAQFYMLNDNITGVLALGSFSARNFTAFGISLLTGLQGLKTAGAERLIVDVILTLRGLCEGYICIAHIIGPKESTEPQAGLDSTTRAGPLARLIVEKIASGADPEEILSYNPIQWTNASHHQFPATSNWLKPVGVIINGHEDSFSQRLGQECQPFEWDPPDYALFKPKDVLIVSNGRCASSCSLFSITMSKSEGVKTIVTGGKHDIPQEYCGTVGGQSTSFSMVDTELKTTKLKNHSLAPPDFLTNSVQGITWRLGFGIDDPDTPEEWQSHPADINFPLTAETINNPVAIWESLARKEFTKNEIFRVQTS
ncbi:hypothetical protein BDZ97DRAFT_1801579 [Flammula alnicola]|nr:hypothetical protein BDZ97DRAFT_1801579 [Flammula alnicola]